jgi:putative NIF3 family GTP cyclohydrolase 1 type 2
VHRRHDPLQRRLATLLRHDISLIAYHLPLDAHPELGNNAQLARVLDLTVTGSFGGNAGRRGWSCWVTPDRTGQRRRLRRPD